MALTIEQDDVAAYEAAADALNARAIDVLCVQHEFGIFGGPAGSYLLTLLRRVRAPIVTTLHTVLEEFTPEQLAVIEELSLLSAQLIVMSERATSSPNGALPASAPTIMSSSTASSIRCRTA